MLVPAPAARPEEQHVLSQRGRCWRMCQEGLSGTGRQQGAPELSFPPPRVLFARLLQRRPWAAPAPHTIRGCPCAAPCWLRVHMAVFHVVDLRAFSIGLCQN